ncbi:MAG: diguanylate cyclase [Thioalkalivibrionaceae bacterium]
MRWIAALTATLYLIYAVIASTTFDGVVAVRPLHALAVPSLLLVIVVMSRYQSLLRPMWWLLAAAPVAANGLHHAVKDFDPAFLFFAPEIYLSIIWTFAISGLLFREAAVSASLIVVLAGLGTAERFSEAGLLWLHLLWIASAFSFGAVGAFVLERAQRQIFDQQQVLFDAARVDDLTGAWNRAHILELFDKLCVRRERDDERFSVIFIDIDRFKSINDQFGHSTGDHVLCHFVALVREHLRPTDAVGRIGGEEFLILLPQTDAAHAGVVAVSLLERIRGEAFEGVGAVTASAGVAEHRRGDRRDNTFSRADVALYRAKNRGRDGVVVDTAS